ncbi:hypothetical protein, partial [Paenibacillus nuruki]|uniref:hypothetical protein n=1 Tax=Paenibacillus nuruki TaxID=1886670 RepID=UPI001C30943B
MDLNNRLKLIEDSTNYYIIDFSNKDFRRLSFVFYHYEIVEYKNLIIELNRERYACDTYEAKELFIDKYRQIYLSSRKTYRRILKQFREDRVK